MSQTRNAGNVWAERLDRRNAAGSAHESMSGNGQLPARKFQDACAEIQANVKKHLSGMQLSSSDEESSGENDDDDTGIISSVLRTYRSGGSDATRTEQILKDSLRNGASSCLICIASIKKSDAIWSCSGCYCSLHLSCIQRWAKDSIYFQTEAAADRQLPNETIDPKKFLWCCPKCRKDYPQQLIPVRYFCFCGKESDPRFDPWLVPHSCGSVCGKPLQPQCDHSCLLLCHPGPCPPCPQTVSISCHCGKSPKKIQRCSSRNWSCDKTCSKPLPCGQHSCPRTCHEGDCPTCSHTSKQKCQCGKTSSKRPCSSIHYQCSNICGKPLPCGHHYCQVTCHSGQCSPCPLSLRRTCPCGKEAFTLPCTAEATTCGDTCGKVLDCLVHNCAQRCHKGNCGTCLQMRVQRCRCGLKEKELPCYKQFQCEIKCKKFKDCRRHPCNRKCCPGTCPPCEQTCGRPLTCKNHKCASRCHQGACYPCPISVQVTCACGKTSVTVPCGSERHTKPPKCTLACTKPSNCHHASQTKHACHFGDCGACRQPCDKIRAGCGHICTAPCHTSVLVQVCDSQKPRAGPWEPKQVPRFERKQLACPPCQVPMPVTCLGGHETRDWPCHKAVPTSCQRPCGRQLACTNHVCTKPCHVTNETLENCELCEEICVKARREGCSHPCTRAKCHAGPCPSCTKLVKLNCHCALNRQLVRCSQWVDVVSAGDPAAKELLLSCKDRCPKLLKCGHRCPLTCHSGACSSEVQCASVTSATCSCKRIKKAVACNSLANSILACDSGCLKKKEQEDKVREEKERLQHEEEERRDRAQVQQFQRKFHKKSNRPPKHNRLQVAEPIWNRCYYYATAAVMVACMAAIMAIYAIQ